MASAAAAPGNAARRRARQATAAALATAGDELSRFPLLSGNRDRALRGGTVTFTSGHGLLISLNNARWVTDARTDSTVAQDPSSGWVTARLTVHCGAGATVRLTARWRLFAARTSPR